MFCVISNVEFSPCMSLYVSFFVLLSACFFHVFVSVYVFYVYFSMYISNCISLFVFFSLYISLCMFLRVSFCAFLCKFFRVSPVRQVPLYIFLCIYLFVYTSPCIFLFVSSSLYCLPYIIPNILYHFIPFLYFSFIFSTI